MMHSLHEMFVISQSHHLKNPSNKYYLLGILNDDFGISQKLMFIRYCKNYFLLDHSHFSTLNLIFLHWFSAHVHVSMNYVFILAIFGGSIKKVPQIIIDHITWLVVWNIWIMFPFSWEFHHPNWRSHIFQDGLSTTNQIIRSYYNSTNPWLLMIRFFRTASFFCWDCPGRSRGKTRPRNHLSVGSSPWRRGIICWRWGRLSVSRGLYSWGDHMISLMGSVGDIDII